MGTDIYAELYLWNRNIDSLIRVLQRIELLGICSKTFLKAEETRLEELRSDLNLRTIEALVQREQLDHWGFDKGSRAWRSSRDQKHSGETAQ
jgi:hypothetical protein